MKKVLALILALCMAFALAVPAYAADEEVSGPLVLYSSMTEFDLEALETCFNEVYPDVEIEVVSGSVGEYTSRIAAEADNPQGDVTWGGLCDSDGMTHEALFEKWVSIHNDEAMEGYSTPNGFYSMDHLSTICFCVNTELEEELGLDIRSYQDLLDPALKGKIVTAPLPVWEAGEKRSVGQGGTGTAVTNQADDPELTKAFLAFCKLSKEGGIKEWTMSSA